MACSDKPPRPKEDPDMRDLFAKRLFEERAGEQGGAKLKHSFVWTPSP